MGLKSVLFVMVMVAAVGAPLMAVEAQLGLIGGLLNLTRIGGTVFCTANGNIGTNGTATPIFPNAAVQLQCGNGNVVSTATTNNMGVFSMVLGPIQMLLSSLLEGCRVVVTTPLSSCDATLPSIGNLVSSLTLLGTTVQGLLNITSMIPTGFLLQP